MMNLRWICHLSGAFLISASQAAEYFWDEIPLSLIDRDQLASPTVGKTADIVPALIVIPSKRMESGSVPIATKQALKQPDGLSNFNFQLFAFCFLLFPSLPCEAIVNVRAVGSLM